MRSTVPKKKTTNSYVNQHDILPSITINSSRARQLLCRVNVTGLRHQVKIKNIYIYFFKIIKQNMETSLRTGFAQIFSCYAKNLSCPKFGGTAALLAPPPPPTLPLYLIEKCFPRIQSFQKCSYTKSTRTYFVLVRPRKFVSCPAVINYTQNYIMENERNCLQP